MSAAAWQSTPAPQDRPIVAMGQVCWRDDEGGGVDPFCDMIRWHRDDAAPGGGYWLYEYGGLAVSSDIEAAVVIFHWIDVPAKAA
jgi:hypothetical protein